MGWQPGRLPGPDQAFHITGIGVPLGPESALREVAGFQVFLRGRISVFVNTFVLIVSILLSRVLWASDTRDNCAERMDAEPVDLRYQRHQ
jgi:hypothetical protein